MSARNAPAAPDMRRMLAAVLVLATLGVATFSLGAGTPAPSKQRPAHAPAPRPASAPPGAAGSTAARPAAQTPPPKGPAAPATSPAPPARHPAIPATFPNGAGRTIAEHACLICHSPMLVTQQRKDSTGWEKTLALMGKWGAPMTPAERDTLRGYLLTNFGPRAAR